MFRRRCRTGAIVVLVAAGLGVVVTGDLQGKIMTEVQPMKMAAAEALYDTVAPAVLDLHHRHARRQRGEVLDPSPRLLSFLATGDFDGEVEGINDLQAQASRPGRPRATTSRTSR